MRLSEIAPRTPVFVDANIFIYHLTGNSHECRLFLERCQEGEVEAISSWSTAVEVWHRLMLAQAADKGWMAPGHGLRGLRRRPDRVRQFGAAAGRVGQLDAMGIRLVPLDREVMAEALRVSIATGLLPGDAIVVATMNLQGVQALATADKDFARVSSLDVYSPGDLT